MRGVAFARQRILELVGSPERQIDGKVAHRGAGVEQDEGAITAGAALEAQQAVEREHAFPLAASQRVRPTPCRDEFPNESVQVLAPAFLMPRHWAPAVGIVAALKSNLVAVVE